MRFIGRSLEGPVGLLLHLRLRALEFLLQGRRFIV